MYANDLQTFKADTIGEIRGFVDKDGEPWFLAAQVCRCLGIKNSADAIAKLKQRMQVVEDWQSKNSTIVSSYSGKMLKCKNISLKDGKNTHQVTIIPESWLYELIFASRKQTAIVFRAWVTGEVLPSLRKHGEYRMEGKLIRKSFTDTIKESGENERMHGHGYSNYSAMVNRSLGLPNKVDRESLSDETLEKLARREDMVRCMVADGKQYWEIKNFLFGSEEQT